MGGGRSLCPERCQYSLFTVLSRSLIHHSSFITHIHPAYAITSYHIIPQLQLGTLLIVPSLILGVSALSILAILIDIAANNGSWVYLAMHLWFVVDFAAGWIVLRYYNLLEKKVLEFERRGGADVEGVGVSAGGTEMNVVRSYVPAPTPSPTLTAPKTLATGPSLAPGPGPSPSRGTTPVVAQYSAPQSFGPTPAYEDVSYPPMIATDARGPPGLGSAPGHSTGGPPGQSRMADLPPLYDDLAPDLKPTEELPVYADVIEDE